MIDALSPGLFAVVGWSTSDLASDRTDAPPIATGGRPIRLLPRRPSFCAPDVHAPDQVWNTETGTRDARWAAADAVASGARRRVDQFNDRATSLARRPGGSMVVAVVDNKVTQLTGLPGEDGLAGFTQVMPVTGTDTVSADSCAGRSTWMGIAGPIGCGLVAAGRCGLSAAASLSGVPALKPIGPISGPLGDGLFPSRADGVRGRHAGAQHHLLEQHQQQQSRPPAGHEVDHISRHCRGPPTAWEPSEARR